MIKIEFHVQSISNNGNNFDKPAQSIDGNNVKLCCLFFRQTNLRYFWQPAVKYYFTSRRDSFCVSITQAPTSHADTVKVVNNCSIIGDDALIVLLVLPWNFISLFISFTSFLFLYSLSSIPCGFQIIMPGSISLKIFSFLFAHNSNFDKCIKFIIYKSFLFSYEHICFMA